MTWVLLQEFLQILPNLRTQRLECPKACRGKNTYTIARNPQMYVYVHIYMYSSMCICMIYTCIYIYIYLYIYIYIYLFICLFIYLCIYSHAYFDNFDICMLKTCVYIYICLIYTCILCIHMYTGDCWGNPQGLDLHPRMKNCYTSTPHAAAALMVRWAPQWNIWTLLWVRFLHEYV